MKALHVRIGGWPRWLIGSALIGLVLWLFRDFGITYDEQVHVNYGDWIFIWYASLFKIDSAVTAVSCHFYGGLADTFMQFVANSAQLLFHWDYYELRHLLNALIGLLGVAFTYRLAKLLGGPAAGFLAAAMLLLTPRYFGDMFNNPKDIPFAVTYLAALYYLIRAWTQQSELSGRAAVKIGLAIGAALGIRIGGFFLYFYAAMALLGWMLIRYGETRVFTRHDTARALGCALIVAIISWSVMLIFWPYAQLSPFMRPLQVLLFMSENPWNGPVLFNGQVFPATELPRSYLPTWLLISLPEFYHLALILGVVVLVPRLRQFRANFLDFLWQAMPVLLLLTSVLVPIGTVLVLHSTLYDGMRHFYFAVPVLAVLGGLALQQFLQKAVCLTRISFGTVLLGLAAITLSDIIELHPYQTAYFNRLFGGGLGQAATKFDTDYWGNTYKEGAAWIQSILPTQSFHVAVPYMAKRLDYYFDHAHHMEARRQMLLHYLGDRSAPWPPPAPAPRIRVIGPDVDPDLYREQGFLFFMTGFRGREDQSFDGPYVLKVARQGALLLVIKVKDLTNPALFNEP